MSHPDLDDFDPKRHEDFLLLAAAVAEAVEPGKVFAWAQLHLVE